MIPTHEDIVNMQRIIWEMKLNKWLHHDVFSWRWWTIAIIMIVPIIIWLRLVDKRRLASITMLGLITVVLTVTLDIIGYETVLWSYPVELLIMVPLLEIDFGILPILYMIIYQYAIDWKKYIIANTCMAAVFAFIFEPILGWAGFYDMYEWKVSYSFPIYILIAIMAKWLTDTIFNIQRSN